ncbi:uncharacterized protein TNCV_1348791 [Trichonephila clavipes]|nr:uncharacterized protein TNCV_1348791 [Trichonephila clavipes]
MSQKSPFVVHKAIIGIGGEPKSIKKLRSGDLLIETTYALQSKSFLLAKPFLDLSLTITPHKSLNSSRGVISEINFLCASETEISEGLSDQGVTQLLQPLSSSPKSDILITTPLISTSSTQAELLPSTSSTEAIVSEPQPPIPVMSASSSGSGIQHPSESSTIPDFKKMQKLVQGRERKNY